MSLFQNLGLLLLRLGFGGMMFLGHGLPKLLRFSERLLDFPNPIGVGPTATLVYAIFAEVFCALFVIFGFFTRLSCIPIILTMLVARFAIYPDDLTRKEYLTLYLLAFVAMALLGPGRYSWDHRKFQGTRARRSHGRG